MRTFSLMAVIRRYCDLKYLPSHNRQIFKHLSVHVCVFGCVSMVDTEPGKMSIFQIELGKAWNSQGKH